MLLMGDVNKQELQASNYATRKYLIEREARATS